MAWAPLRLRLKNVCSPPKGRGRQYPIVNTCHTFFSHLFVEEYVVGFHFFTTVKNSNIDSNLEWKRRTLESDLYVKKKYCTARICLWFICNESLHYSNLPHFMLKFQIYSLEICNHYVWTVGWCFLCQTRRGSHYLGCHYIVLQSINYIAL